jgi:hypothetical protein
MKVGTPTGPKIILGFMPKHPAAIVSTHARSVWLQTEHSALIRVRKIAGGVRLVLQQDSMEADYKFWVGWVGKTPVEQTTGLDGQ